MRTVLMLVAVLLIASPVEAQESQPDNWMRAGFVSLAAVSMADIDTTGRALERGLQERNPILKPFAGTPGAAGLVSGAISGGLGLGAYQLHKRGKRKEARLVIWAWTLVRTAVVIHNVRQLRR